MPAGSANKFRDSWPAVAITGGRLKQTLNLCKQYFPLLIDIHYIYTRFANIFMGGKNLVFFELPGVGFILPSHMRDSIAVSALEMILAVSLKQLIKKTNK